MIPVMIWGHGEHALPAWLGQAAAKARPRGWVRVSQQNISWRRFDYPTIVPVIVGYPIVLLKPLAQIATYGVWAVNARTMGIDKVDSGHARIYLLRVFAMIH